MNKAQDLIPLKCDRCTYHITNKITGFCEEEVWKMLPPLPEDVMNCEKYKGEE